MNSLEESLHKWTNLEPQRCQWEGGDIFEVLYQGHWYPVNSRHPSSHGTLIVAMLEACEARNYLYSIERVPRPDPDSGYDSEPEILVGVGIHKYWQYRQGDSLTSVIPELLLGEYLNRLEKII